VRATVLVFLAAALASGSAVAAEAGRPSLVVMDLEPKGVTPLQAEAATQGVVRGLRELDVFQVLSAADVRQLLALERGRQLLGGTESNGAAELAKALGARHAVTGTMTKVGNGLQVEIRLLDTTEQKVISQKTLGPVARMEAVAAQLPGISQELVAPLLQAQQGELWVRSSEEAAEVVVDDVLVASTPMRAPVKLPRGAHRLLVRKDGFIAQVRTVRILPDQVNTEEFSLVPSADYAEAYRDRHGRQRTGAIIFTGVAVAGIGGAVLVDRLFTEPTYQRKFLPLKESADGVVASKLPSQIRNDPELYGLYTQCGLQPADCQETLASLRGQLFATQLTTVGLAAVGVIATGVASYLWISGKDPNRYANVVATVSVGREPGLVVMGHF